MLGRVFSLLAALAAVAATARFSKFDVRRDSTVATTVDGTVVGAKFECLGFLCPKWRLLVSRYDVVRVPQQQYEFNLAELLPYAPTAQRSANLWTAYNPANRHYTVAVQDYPAAGLDTFFVVQINNDVTSATTLVSNVVIGHPDGAPGNPGKMTLSRVIYDADGNLMVLFKDGSLHSLDLTTKTYKLLTDITPDNTSLAALSNAVVRDGQTLKSITYDASNNACYLTKTDLTTFAVSNPVPLQPLKGYLGQEKPIAAHQMTDPNTGKSFLGVIYAGNFDQILSVDETTGVQTAIMSDLYNDAGVPNEFQCTASTKDCDTLWATTAYDAKNHALYFQTHWVEEDISTTYIFGLGYSQNKVTHTYYPYVNADVQMTFGYSGYQWVSFS